MTCTSRPGVQDLGHIKNIWLTIMLWNFDFMPDWFFMTGMRHMVWMRVFPHELCRTEGGDGQMMVFSFYLAR